MKLMKCQDQCVCWGRFLRALTLSCILKNEEVFRDVRRGCMCGGPDNFVGSKA